MAFKNAAQKKYFQYLESKGKLPKEPGDEMHDEMRMAFGGRISREDSDNFMSYGKEDYEGYPDYKRMIDEDDAEHYYRGGRVHTEGDGEMSVDGRKQEDYGENQAYQTEDEKTGDPYIYNSSGEPNTNRLLRSKHDMEYMAQGGYAGNKRDISCMSKGGIADRPNLPEHSFAKALKKKRMFG